MAKLVILGSASAVPDPSHENTHMAVCLKGSTLLIDCSGTPIVRLAEAGISIASIDDIILTHFHPDHVGSIPILLMNMWLQGREQALRIFGLHHCLARIEDMMGLYQWEKWPDFYPVTFHRLPERERVLVLEKNEMRVYSSPVKHVIPTIGLRIEVGNNSTVYSCDTEPIPAMVRLAEGADVLIHEATGEEVGHSSAGQAGEIAREAGAKRLILIHYPVGEHDSSELLNQAKENFAGEIALAEDFMEIELG